MTLLQQKNLNKMSNINQILLLIRHMLEYMHHSSATKSQDPFDFDKELQYAFKAVGNSTVFL